MTPEAIELYMCRALAGLPVGKGVTDGLAKVVQGGHSSFHFTINELP
jgi:hypothetical protein